METFIYLYQGCLAIGLGYFLAKALYQVWKLRPSKVEEPEPSNGKVPITFWVTKEELSSLKRGRNFVIQYNLEETSLKAWNESLKTLIKEERNK